MQTVPLHAPSSAVDVQVCALHTLHPVQWADANVVHLQEYHCILRNVDTTLLSCKRDASGTCWKQRSSAQCTNVLHTLWSQDKQICCRFRMEMSSFALISSLKG